MVVLYRISIVLFLAFHCQSIVFFKKHQQGWLFLNRTKSDPFLPLLSLEQEVKMQSTNSLPFVGEEISFFMTNGGVFMNGSIQSVSSQGTDISVYSGSLQLGGYFHLSYSSGVIVGEVHPSNEDFKYQILPKDSSLNLYTMRAVSRSVYDNDDSPADEYPSLEFEGDAGALRRQQIQSHPHGMANITSTTQRTSDQVGADYNPALYSSNILDVMFIFTPQALASVGGSQSSMEALAALSVQLANEAYANSLLPVRMRMVSVATLKDTTYVEKGFTTELNRLRSNNDGFFDAEVNIRTYVGADVVILFTSDTNYCGLAYMWATESLAFAVVSTQCPFSVVHEVAHNIGCDHDRMTAHSYDYNQYNLGYCWDTSAKTCSRSVMAYAGCVTPGRRTNCPRMPYFSSPLVTQGALKRTTGIATSDNARVIREQLSRAVSWRPSKVPGGLITSAQPTAAAVGRCEPVRIKGFRIGTATSTITSVTLNGVPVQRILSQSLDEVAVLAGLSDVAGTGDIVVTTSSGYQTTLAGAFSYQATSGSFVTDFDSGLGTLWVSTGAADWSVVHYCDVEPCNNPPLTGPVVGVGGSGNYLKVQAFEASDDVTSLTATFNRDITAGGCVEAVTSLSLYYHLWGPHSDLCGGSLTVSMLTIGSAAWTTILTASTVQAQQSDPWLPLQFSFPNPTAVAAIRITADPHSGQASCYYWGSVAVDRINVTKTTTCPKNNCDFISAAPTVVPTAVPTARPSTIRPTTPLPSSWKPTIARTPAPTSVESVVEVVRFECTQTLIGVNSQQFLADPRNLVNFLSIASSALNIPADGTCCATTLDDVEQRLSVGHLRRLTKSRLCIIYKVEMRVAHEMSVVGGRNTSSGDSGTPTLSEEAVTRVNAAQEQFAASISSGDFLSALKQVLSPEIARANFGVAPVSSSSFSAPVSEIVQLSTDPTFPPTTRVIGGGSASTASLTWDLVACIMLAVIVLFAVMLYIYCLSPNRGKPSTQKLQSLAAAARNRAMTDCRFTPTTYDQVIEEDDHGIDDVECTQVKSSMARRDCALNNGNASIKDGGKPPISSNTDTVIFGYRPASSRRSSLDLRPLSLPRSPTRVSATVDAEEGGVELADVMAFRRAQWTATVAPAPFYSSYPTPYVPYTSYKPQPYRQASLGSCCEAAYSGNHPAVDNNRREQIPPELLSPPYRALPAHRQGRMQQPPQLLAPGILPRMVPQVVNGSGAVFPPPLQVQIGDASVKYLSRAQVPHPPVKSALTPSEVAMATHRQVSLTRNADEFSGYRRYLHSATETPKLEVRGASMAMGLRVVVQGRPRGSGPCPPAPPDTPQYTVTQPSTTPTMSHLNAHNMGSCSISGAGAATSTKGDHEAHNTGYLQDSNSCSFISDSTRISPRIPPTGMPKRGASDTYSARSQRFLYRSSSAATELGEYPSIWGDPQLAAQSFSTDVADGARTPSLFTRSLSASHDLNATSTSPSPSPHFLSHYQRTSMQLEKQQSFARLNVLDEEGSEVDAP